MDPSTLLSQLRDIHPPEPISAWPPAIGWWLVAIVTLITLFTLSYFLLRSYLQNAWKRQAIKSFQKLRSTYQQAPSSNNLLMINKLLKQALSSAKRNRTYLQLSESGWENALLEVRYKGSSILNDQDITILSSDIYARHPPALDDAALDRLSLWIKHLG